MMLIFVCVHKHNIDVSVSFFKFVCFICSYIVLKVLKSCLFFSVTIVFVIVILLGVLFFCISGVWKCCVCKMCSSV